VVKLAVNGTLMRGLELNANMLEAKATFLRDATTAPVYRLWSVNDRHPAMIRVLSGGASIALEVWAVPPEGLAQILLREPPGLCIGKVTLADGEEVLGVLGEPTLCEGQREITQPRRLARLPGIAPVAVAREQRRSQAGYGLPVRFKARSPLSTTSGAVFLVRASLPYP